MAQPTQYWKRTIMGAEITIGSDLSLGVRAGFFRKTFQVDRADVEWLYGVLKQVLGR